MKADTPDGYPADMPPQVKVKLKDLKARKGHLCLGGDWPGDEGPLCGCGVALHTVPDFMGDGGARFAPPRGPAPDEVYAAQAADGMGAHYAPDDDPPPWDTTDAETVHDELGERGKTLTDTRDGYPDMNPAVPPIDPTAPYGPAEVERAILDAVARLERGLKHEANLIAACDQLKLEYDLAYARAIEQSTGGAADVRKANAVLACERQYRAYMEGCAARDAMKAVTHTLRATLSGLQSVGRSVGVTYQAPQGRGR